MATQKPVVLVKDDATNFPFDTSPNRYIQYPRDLRHPEIQRFIALLAANIERAKGQDPANSFIGQLGPFKVPEVESREIPLAEALMERFDRLEQRVHHSLSRQSVAGFREIEHSGTKMIYEGNGQVSVITKSYISSQLEEALRTLAGSEKYGKLAYSLSGKSNEGAAAAIVGLRSSQMNDFLRSLVFELEHGLPF